MRFPEDSIHISEFHHWNDFSDDTIPELLIINLSDYLANMSGYVFFNPDIAESHTGFEDKKSITQLKQLASLKHLKLKPQKVVKIAEEIQPVIKDSLDAF